MAKIKEYREIPLDDLVIGKGQVRVKEVQKEIEELAESIRVQGLLQPILVCASDKKGKYEILTGQRRFLAHKHLKRKAISAAILDEHVDEETAKSISATENLMRRDISLKEKVDYCTAMYNKYGSIKATAEETGIPVALVSEFVKFDRLIPELKKMVTNGDVKIKAALRAQDAAAAGGEDIDPKEAIKLAKEIGGMSGVQQKKLVKEREENPDASVDDVIEQAKTGGKITQIVVSLGPDLHKHLQNFTQAEGYSNQDDAAATLLEEALLAKGYGG